MIPNLKDLEEVRKFKYLNRFAKWQDGSECETKDEWWSKDDWWFCSSVGNKDLSIDAKVKMLKVLVVLLVLYDLIINRIIKDLINPKDLSFQESERRERDWNN